MKPIPLTPIEGQPEEALIGCLLWGEARGEPAVGKLAVAWVAKNRALKNGTTIKQEILRARQFSCFNLDDPNRATLRQAPGIDPTGWARCETVADLLPASVDPTHGATHYYNAKTATPLWGRGHAGWIECCEIGQHIFGRAT